MKLAAWKPANYLAFLEIARNLSLELSSTRKSMAFAGSINALINASEIGTSGGILLWTGLTLIAIGALCLLMVRKGNESGPWKLSKPAG